MRLRLVRLEVEAFGPVRRASVELGGGLNVLYGENDLGKSHLAHAVRTALLLPHTSTAHREFVAWGETDKAPRVELIFQVDETYWRVKKAFGRTQGTGATLERSPNGDQWSTEAKAREVDTRLRGLLEWGIPEPGGKGKKLSRGLPRSFLTRALLAEQHGAEGIFDHSLIDDPDESGKKLLGQALRSLAQDPLFKDVLERAQRKVDEAFLPTGKKRRGRDDPFPKASLAIRRAFEEHERCQGRLEATLRVREQLESVSRERLEAQQAEDEAMAALEALEQARRAQEAEEKLAEAEAQLARLAETQDAAAELDEKLERHELELEQAEEALRQAERHAEDARQRQREAESDQGVRERELEEQRLEKNLLELRAAKREAEARLRASELLEKAAELRAAGNTVLAELDERHLPSLDEVRALRELARQLEVSRARLDVGVSVKLRLTRAVDIEVSQDGGEPEETAGAIGEHLVEAKRSVALGLDGFAELEISAGAPEARRETEDLARRWREEATPVLEAAGATEVEELARLRRTAEDKRRDAEQQIAEAARFETEAAQLANVGEARREQAEAEVTRIAEELDGVTARLRSIGKARGTELDEVRSVSAAAVKRLEKARHDVKSRRQERDRVKGTLESRRGQLEVLRENAGKIDLATLKSAAEKARSALGYPLPASPRVTDERIARALRAHEQAVRTLADRTRDADKLQGALEQVGGEAAVERERRAREALELARQRERELELDYGAWHLLVETLRRAEDEESMHLGRALMGPVSEKFTELTGGRYGRIGLDPDLRTTGIRAGGDGREVTALSQGLKEQLATIFRLSVAQHLGSMILLDDQLTHTDPRRLTWFRDVLRQCGETIQVVVLTCHPQDYLFPDEMAGEGDAVKDGASGRLRGVNLERVVERALPP